MKQILKNKMDLMENRIDAEWAALTRASGDNNKNDVDYHLSKIREAEVKLSILEMLWQNVTQSYVVSTLRIIEDSMKKIEQRFDEKDLHIMQAKNHKSIDTIVLDVKDIPYDALVTIQGMLIPKLEQNKTNEDS